MGALAINKEWRNLLLKNSDACTRDACKLIAQRSKFPSSHALRYLHNDLHLREAPKDWPGGWEAWAKQGVYVCVSSYLPTIGCLSWDAKPGVILDGSNPVLRQLPPYA
eukprot:1145678-Pelagomonas_calceolata.AAC.4